MSLQCFKHNTIRRTLTGRVGTQLRYDSVYLTCSKKLTGSQLSLPHGINKKLKCESKNKMSSMIGLLFITRCSL